MHEEDLIDSEAAQKRVDAILHEAEQKQARTRKRRSDAGTPRTKKAQWDAEPIVLLPRILMRHSSALRIASALIEEDSSAAAKIINAVADSLTARKEG